MEWDALYDRDRGVVKSTTGELECDYARRIVSVRSAETQGVVGFAGGQQIDLSGVTVAVSPARLFVSLLLTPLDDKPLGESGHVLVTALARDRQSGARYSDGGRTLEDTGGPPLLLEPVQAVLTFKGPRPASVRPLDTHGVQRDVAVEHIGQKVVIDGRYATYYYEVRTVANRPVTPSPTGTSVSPTGGPPTVQPDQTPRAPEERLFLPRVEKVVR